MLCVENHNYNTVSNHEKQENSHHNQKNKKCIDPPRAMIFVDYENIYKRIEDYGSNIFSLDLAGRIKDYFVKRGLYIVDFLLYANFNEDNYNFSYHQQYFKDLGVTTKHTSLKGKNGSDIELVVDALKMLFTHDDVDAYIIISSDRDMLPLIQAIRQENKIVIFVSTKTKFGSGMLYTTDYHEYLEDILGIEIEEIIDDDDIDPDTITAKDLEDAREVVIMLISSNIWKRHIAGGTPIHFEEYKKLIAKNKRFKLPEVQKCFMVAKARRWIKLYKFQRKNELITGIRAGDKLDEIIESDAYKRHFLGTSYNKKQT